MFTKTAVPLFVNRAALFEHAPKGRLPRAQGRWALDSGGYMALKLHGGYTFTAEQYVAEVRRAVSEIGRLDFAASLDWMCEEEVLARTGLTVEEHQGRTIDSYLHLRAAGGADLEHLWVPVLQGSCPADYIRHFEMWLASGVDLRMVNVVGVGSVCRRWKDTQLRDIFSYLRGQGLTRLHGFGVKQSSLEWSAVLRRPTRADVAALYERALERGLPYDVLEEALRNDPEFGATTWESEEATICHFLYSADSAAWSSRARNQGLEVKALRRSVFGTDADPPGTDPELAGLRPVSERSPTQMLPECSRRALAWRPGKGRKPHVTCNQCVPWALEYRRRLQTLLAPQGCWDEAPTKRALPPPGFEAHRAAIEKAAQLAEQWERYGPERFAPLSELPTWAQQDALRRRAAGGKAPGSDEA